MYSFPIAEAWIEQQLADIAGKLSLFQRAADLFAEMHLAIQAEGIRGSDAVRAAGSYGGIMKKWQAGLLQAITMDLIKHTAMDTGGGLTKGKLKYVKPLELVVTA